MQKTTIFLITLFCTPLIAQAEELTHSTIENVDFSHIKYLGKPLINATHYRLVKIDTARLRQELVGAHRLDGVKGREQVISLPLPDGSNHQYSVVENNTMSPDLAAKFPQIKAYNAYGVDSPQEFVKFDVTPLGVHAMILSPGKSTVFIDPVFRDNINYYMVYKQSDFREQEKRICEVGDSSKPSNYYTNPSFNNYQTCFLRKYRLALAAAADYTNFFGGVTNALAAQVVSVNRINGMYETEIGVTLELIANNDQIVFTLPYPPGVIPYTISNSAAMILQNQHNLDFVIGNNNYDIGHLFNLGSGGLAKIDGVCNSAWKGQAESGSTTPLGPGYDFQFVAHEMGHQFGATHVQNNDFNRWNPTAVEPGSGSTTMSYAGVSWPNVQNHSDPYFNGINLQQIGRDFTGEGTESCAVKIPIAPAPIVANIANITIPASTPFALTGQASGADSARFTYTWEQEDNDITIQPPVPDAYGGPNFRSIPPTSEKTRFFPRLKLLANNGPYTWEVLPSVNRIMHFRLSVRSNRPGGSCNAYKDMTVTVDATSGPFELTYPNVANVQWKGGTKETIKWNVANTNKLPVHETKVSVWLSTDGGLTYPIKLAQSVANNGAYQISVPTISTNKARIMVRANSGNFFTISQNNFKITK